MASSDDILGLVRTALDEFEERSLEVSVRRAVRIANLMGDTKYAIRLSLEIRPTGGDRERNGEMSRMLMTDPSTWGSGTGPSEEAINQYMNGRKFTREDTGEEVVEAHTLSEIEFWDQELHELKKAGDRFGYATDLASRERTGKIVARTRHLTFALLCWVRILWSDRRERLSVAGAKISAWELSTVISLLLTIRTRSGPWCARTTSRPRRVMTGYDGFDVNGMDPTVDLLPAEVILSGRSAETVQADPRHGHLLATAEEGQLLCLSLTDALRDALATADRGLLHDVAQAWAASDVFPTPPDPDGLAGFLDQAADLASRAVGRGHRLYSWICV
ncbi:hypothetical protein [Streptomyces sp. NPDC056670]|uniref:hypothetical protein n=1 Tax=Streptomyces sp. NPDC056670 TaxID=3345904 RepID=UPI00368561EF